MADGFFRFAGADVVLDRAATFLELVRFGAFLTGFLVIEVSSPRDGLVPDAASYTICSIGVYGSSIRKPLGPNTSSASGVRMIGGTATETTTTRWP